MLSIEHCRQQLEKYGKKYTDQQIEEIRDKLYQICQRPNKGSSHKFGSFPKFINFMQKEQCLFIRN